MKRLLFASLFFLLPATAFAVPTKPEQFKKLENELQPDFLTKIKQKTIRDKMNVDYLFKIHNYEKKYSDHKKCKINYPLKNEVLFKFKTSLNKKSLIDKIKIKLKEINGLLDKLRKEF